MISKEYLKNIRHEAIELEHLKGKIKGLYSSLFPGGLKLKEIRVQESVPYDKMAEKFAEFGEAVAEFEQRIGSLTRRQLEAERLISLLEDVRHRNVLELYYLSEKRTNLNKVAEIMNYSAREIDYLHSDALKALDKIMRDNAEVSRESNLDPKSSSGNEAKS